MRSWPFKDDVDTAVITTQVIIDGRQWIASVSHDLDDGTWQFLGPEASLPDVSDAVVVSLGEIVETDQSLLELADLPAGWLAWRDSKNAPWQRSPIV